MSALMSLMSCYPYKNEVCRCDSLSHDCYRNGMKGIPGPTMKSAAISRCYFSLCPLLARSLDSSVPPSLPSCLPHTQTRAQSGFITLHLASECGGAWVQLRTMARRWLRLDLAVVSFSLLSLSSIGLPEGVVMVP